MPDTPKRRSTTAERQDLDRQEMSDIRATGSPRNMNLQLRGSAPERIMAPETIRARGTAGPSEVIDDTPTPAGQGGIGSDTVADQRAPEDVPAYAKGGRVKKYAKGGDIKRNPPLPPERPPVDNPVGEKWREIDNAQQRTPSLRPLVTNASVKNPPYMAASPPVDIAPSPDTGPAAAGYAKGGSVGGDTKPRYKGVIHKGAR